MARHRPNHRPRKYTWDTDANVQRRIFELARDGAWRTAKAIAEATGCPPLHVASHLRVEQRRGHKLEFRVGPHAPGKTGRPPSEYRLTASEAALVAPRGAARKSAFEHARWRTEVAPLIAKGFTAKQIALACGVTMIAMLQRLERLGLQAVSEKRQRFCCRRHNKLERLLMEREERARTRKTKRYAKTCGMCDRYFSAKHVNTLVCGKKCRRAKAAVKKKIIYSTRRGYVA